MKALILIMIFFSTVAQAGELCKDNKVKEDAFNWAENSFNETRAKESMAALQSALNNNGSINNCKFHNALQIVEGYILKQQAQAVETQKDAPDKIKKGYVEDFCLFLKESKPCE
jgi:hypothetical protein